MEPNSEEEIAVGDTIRLSCNSDRSIKMELIEDMGHVLESETSTKTISTNITVDESHRKKFICIFYPTDDIEGTITEYITLNISKL